MLKRAGLLGLLAIAGLFLLELGGALFLLEQSGIVSIAEARVGRPLTPMSVAGVTRRTVRRCAVGVYNC